MQEFVKAGVPETQLEIINIMQMSIRAMTLSDICMEEERSITNQAWTLVNSNEIREEYDWSRKPNEFSSNQIIIWQQALTKTFIRTHKPRGSRKLKFSFVMETRFAYWYVQNGNGFTQIMMKASISKNHINGDGTEKFQEELELNALYLLMIAILIYQRQQYNWLLSTRSLNG